MSLCRDPTHARRHSISARSGSQSPQHRPSVCAWRRISRFTVPCFLNLVPSFAFLVDPHGSCLYLSASSSSNGTGLSRPLLGRFCIPTDLCCSSGQSNRSQGNSKWTRLEGTANKRPVPTCRSSNTIEHWHVVALS